MKVTAILPDDLVKQVNKYAQGKTLTESISVALREWLKMEKLKRLNRSIDATPLEFGLPGHELRKQSRRRK